MRVAGIIPVNNVAERGLRGLALGRKSWLFAGSERGAERAAVLRCIADTPQTQLADLLPWNWRRWSAKFAA
jgi:transposase